MDISSVMAEFVEARDAHSAVHRRWRMQDICHSGAAHSLREGGN
ncbi:MULTISPECIES: hypothetical protein [unclassified Variovorax]|nr:MULTISPECIES: hypothetical protein [unclassified Variovorax]